MDVEKDEIIRIKELLKKYPRGINVIDIAKAVNLNRQTVTKYLEMMIVSGNVDVKTFGPSKVYYLTQRLPVSSMISLSSDFILILDRGYQIINVNEPFLDFTRMKKENLIGHELGAIRFPVAIDPPIVPYIDEALEGRECRIEANYRRNQKDLCYSIKFIPVVFDDGQPGVSVMFEDITERKRAEMELIAAKKQADIYLDLLSHDISNMHQVALIQLQLAQDVLGESEGSMDEMKEYIDNSIAALDRSTRLIDGVRRLQQPPAGARRVEKK